MRGAEDHSTEDRKGFPLGQKEGKAASRLDNRGLGDAKTCTVVRNGKLGNICRESCAQFLGVGDDQHHSQ